MWRHCKDFQLEIEFLTAVRAKRAGRLTQFWTPLMPASPDTGLEKSLNQVKLRMPSCSSS